MYNKNRQAQAQAKRKALYLKIYEKVMACDDLESGVATLEKYCLFRKAAYNLIKGE